MDSIIKIIKFPFNIIYGLIYKKQEDKKQEGEKQNIETVDNKKQEDKKQEDKKQNIETVDNKK